MILLELVTPEPEPGNLRLRFQQLNERVLGRCREDDLRKENENMKDEICPTSLKMNSDKMRIYRKIGVGHVYETFGSRFFVCKKDRQYPSLRFILLHRPGQRTASPFGSRECDAVITPIRKIRRHARRILLLAGPPLV